MRIYFCIGLLILQMSLHGADEKFNHSKSIHFFKGAKTIEILSLNPGRVYKEKVESHHKLESWKILGKKTIVDPTDINQVIGALKESLITNNVIGASCFNPRHAVLYKEHKIIICFECSRIKINGRGYIIDSDGKDIINKIWKKYKII